MKKILVSLACVLAFFVSGCSSLSTPAPSESSSSAPESMQSVPDEVKDEVFLTTIRAEYPEFEGVPDASLVEFGHNVCKGLDSGLTLDNLFTIAKESGFEPEVGGFLIGASIAAYCPEYRPLLDNSTYPAV